MSAIFILLQHEELHFEEQFFFLFRFKNKQFYYKFPLFFSFATFDILTEKHRILESTSARLRLGKKAGLRMLDYWNQYEIMSKNVNISCNSLSLLYLSLFLSVCFQ